jgi:argininosuccinate lyase
MKLWNKGVDPNKKIEEFTVGNDRILDLQLAKYDVQGSLAHIKMLDKVGLLQKDDYDILSNELKNISNEIDNGQFTIEEQFEDVHSKIEYELTKRLGDVGKKIHSARSRNDQILVDMHLFLKDKIDEIKSETKILFDSLIDISEVNKQILIPGYTHLQVAMPSSFGMFFAAYGESLIDDVYFLNASKKIADQNPLGSAAGYGSSFPIDRQMTTDLLGFANLKVNSVAAQMSRGKLEKSLSFAMASMAGSISKFAMDITLYNSQNFNFLTFPDELTTGSSIMPHKKNPDVFELIRAKCNKIQALPYELTLVQNNLPSGYHRDFQLLKESLLPAIEELLSCIDMTNFMIKNIQVNKSIVQDDKYKYIFSVEEVNKLVLQGKTFRDAYVEVGSKISKGEFEADFNIQHSHIGSIGNLSNDLIIKKMEEAIQ